MKFLVMVSLLVAVISCRADKAPRKIKNSTNQTSNDLTVKPRAIINGGIVGGSTTTHTVTIVSQNTITKKFKYAFVINGEKCQDNYRKEMKFPTHKPNEETAKRIITLNDNYPNGKRKLCVKGITEDGRTQAVASTKNWNKTDPQVGKNHQNITARLYLDRKGDNKDPEVDDNKKVADKVYIKVTKNTNSTATKFAYKKYEECGNNEDIDCDSCEKNSRSNGYSENTNNLEGKIEIGYPSSNKLGWRRVCIYGLDDNNESGTVQNVDWKFVPKEQMATSNERIQIIELPRNCSSPTNIELTSSADEDDKKITQYKYRLYDGDHNCPTNDLAEYTSPPYNLDEPIRLSLQDGEKTLCIIGLGDKDSADNYNYIQQKPTKHQWFYQQQQSLRPEDPDIQLDIPQEVALEFIPGISNYHPPTITISNTGSDQFEWELLVINNSRKAGNIIQVKKTDTSELNDDSNDWHNLREHCSNPIVSGSLNAGDSQHLQFKLADVTRTNYGRPYFRTQEIAIRRKGYAQSLRLTVNFKIPKLGMKFQTVTTNEAGIPRITLGPSRRRQTIEIVDISGNNLPVDQFPAGFGWCQYPVAFKPKWFYRIPKCDNSTLKIGLAPDMNLWPDTTKTTRIVVYSNGDSEHSDTGRREYMTSYSWIHEENDGNKNKKTIKVPRYDSARNYIEIVFDPDL